MRRTTVYDVAKEAGVSTATVSFTFRRPDKVKPETRERVLAAAKMLDYVPSANARGLARGQTGVLGLYSFDMLIERPIGDDDEDDESAIADMADEEFDCPSVLSYPLYVDEVQRGFELECRRRNRAVLLGTAVRRDDGAGITDVAGRVDGLAVFPNKFTDTLPLTSLCRSIPIVRLSEGAGTDPAAYITCDNVRGVNLLIDHLVDVHGVHDIQFVGSMGNYDGRQRFAAMRSRLKTRGLRVPERPLDDSTAGTHEHFVTLCETIDMGRLPQALVCATDQTAFEVLAVLRDAGVRVPQDVLVTGFDGILAGRMLDPALTTVRQPMGAMGQLAARLLDERAGEPWKESEQYHLPVRLVVRNSCGC
ncbi:LacI family DNA-binding transcriptional regulator [Bifidobacterium sp. SO4]|uniref:LacI family DNA-binding transcriptional regulator n=1 Tax=Bifidobacterium sp. SO4 TaxID=2809030 RepID=UPI001BDD81F3|nr:LacI family DNA-binding transcriptional regulator [Bifidobacterium sp. SO4]MBT1170622.1 LacI family DNA-binding transcriptional regulator [Bifidobacterium sp. SO4]